VDVTLATSPSATPIPPANSFLQNKVASGTVFALAGLVGLVVILAIAIFAIRRRNNRKLMKEAISFDPTVVMDDDYHDSGKRTTDGFDADSGNYRSHRSEHEGMIYPFAVNNVRSDHIGGYSQPSASATGAHGYTHDVRATRLIPNQHAAAHWGSSNGRVADFPSTRLHDTGSAADRV